MRYLPFILAALALPALALDVVVDGENVGQTDKLVIDSGRVVINTNSQPEPEPEPNPDPEPAPEPQPEPHPGGCNQQNVKCADPITNWPSENENYITVPSGKILASAFTMGGSGTEYGSISFEARHSRGVDVWISEAPGGPAVNDSRCSKDDVSFYFVIKWAAFEWNQACSLEPGGTYYLNMKSLDGKSYRVNRAVY